MGGDEGGDFRRSEEDHPWGPGGDKDSKTFKEAGTKEKKSRQELGRVPEGKRVGALEHAKV